MDEWHPPSTETYPDGPSAFPATGVNSLATIRSRWMARTIDSVVVAVPVLLVSAVIVVVATAGDPAPEADETRLTSIWTWGAVVLAAIVYETICITLWGQTLGKALLGIRVARQANGRCPVWWEAALRISVPGVVAVIPHPAALLGAMVLFMLATFDPIRRGIPDRAAGTVVVRLRPGRARAPETAPPPA